MIYLDYHATTPVDPRVADRVYHFMTQEFGNASSVDHEWGDRAEAAVKQAAKQVADLIGASPREIVWTSGATESINLAIQGSLLDPLAPLGRGGGGEGKHRIGLMPIEHKAVLDTCRALEKRGWAELVYLQVDPKGRLNLNHLEEVCARGLSLLCVMAANNEIGNIYPMQTIGQIAQHYGIPFLCDGAQAVGKIPLQFEDWGMTYLAISAHKFYGPKGVGALVVRRGYSLEPMIFGGGHQRGLRSGTLNVPGIVGLGEACRLRSLEMEEDERAIAIKRDKLQTLLLEKISGLVVNGDTDHRLAGNLHLSIPDIPNSAIIARVRHQLAISTGSACSSGVEAPSHVLPALNLPENTVDGALRIGLGKFTTAEEIEQAATILSIAAYQVRESLAISC
ncbi:cysteine desulfurase family protein [Leptodesmis sichuanensis]|uniref:cysteine desulfurase family protein n=1 Tax=Leptodesmis sichuanensis TaxID=2906798 RepID=UPI001F2D3336|nr:cysteine desulfurase family protein [Leptodesmis sichuanensis]UIE39131.1 cysteine desulfurase [Leptodesmis sichuanensis A121]